MPSLALVTGASAGIGFRIAEQLAERGYDIIGVGASERIFSLAEALPHARVIPVRADLTRREGVDALWSAVIRQQRPLEVAALNAGASLGGAFIDTDIEAELDLLALNVTGQVLLAKHVTRHMAAARQGRILITTSLSALTPTPYESIYGPTRAFMYSFAQGLREELRDYGVSVTALLPGATATEFHERAGMGDTAFGDNSRKTDPRLVARLGVDGLFDGRDRVVGLAPAGRRKVWWDRFRSDESKARRFAQQSKPRPNPTG